MIIQELERRTGLERSSIRFYEKEGLLKPKRLENGYRDYSEEDVQLLKRIKLLRRLGMSVEKIRALQQGNEDLGSAIAKLTAYHTSQIDDHKRCRAVCEAIRDDGAAFGTLDAEHYWTLLREIRINDRPLGRTDFQETVPEEIHPWRRFFARTLDYGLWGALISLVYIVLLRLRPLPGDFGNALITILGMALFVPVEAWMISRFGTTPGKFALGIRLESIQGGNLTWGESLERSWNVYVRGMGCCVPMVEPAVKLVRYCQLTGRTMRRFARYDQIVGPQDMVWDYETEIFYETRDRKRVIATALVLAAAIGLNLLAASDGIKPKYRGNELTVSQFAENYNAYLSWSKDNIRMYDELQPDGSFYPIPANTAILDINDSRHGRQMRLQYELEGEILRAVSVTYDWDSVFFIAPLNGVPLDTAVSLLMAQEGCGIRELMEFTKLFEANLNRKETSFVYKNLLVEWTITTDLPMHDGVIQTQGGENAEDKRVELYFKVTIQ